MCGIFGYTGKKNSVSVSIAGLKKLEYRGYDSAGIAGIKGNKIQYCREVGKVSALETQVTNEDLSLDIAIAHTRWATHGRPSAINAHPQLDKNEELAVMHNGIVENYDSLRTELKCQGYHFRSQTDTEVIAHLISSLYRGDILQAMTDALKRMRGAFAFALIHKDHPDQIFATTQECPLVVGMGPDENFISSDPNAFLNHTNEIVILKNHEVVVISAGSVKLYDKNLTSLKIQTEKLDVDAEAATKGQFQHYMLKEIYEQPTSIGRAMLHRCDDIEGSAKFDELQISDKELVDIQQILIIACGTSLHAGMIVAHMLEKQAKIPVKVEIASEFRYRDPVVLSNTLVIGISQSGETADTLAAIRQLKSKGCKVLGICNVQASALARESDSCLFLHAGPEICVASTKTFTSQLVVLSLFALKMARLRNSMNQIEGRSFIHALQSLPDQVKMIFSLSAQIHEIAAKYADFQDIHFVGRNVMFPTCLEGALKLKEISYANANGYPAGEMKHGPLALVNKECLIVGLCCNEGTYEKMISNLMEIKARDGKVLVVAFEGAKGLEEVADDAIFIPRIVDELAAIPTTVITQMLSYEIAKLRGAEIDQPRNLAKSVTVE